MSTNMTGFRWFSKKLCILVLWTKVASALEGFLSCYCPEGGICVVHMNRNYIFYILPDMKYMYIKQIFYYVNFSLIHSLCTEKPQ